MARRRTKKRTHVGANNGAPNAKNSASAMSKTPKSMVIRIGASEVGPSVSQLVTDVRHMLEPETASRLKERKANRLRDYLTMAGPLGVTHLLLFSRSEKGNTNMRLALTPRGPTLHFRVEKYSLCKDVRKALRRPPGSGKEHLTPPLLVMNNFMSPDSDTKKKIPKHLESLTTTVFQSLFAPISPQTTPLTSIKRVMLLNREKPKAGEDEDSYILNLRHYAITTKTVGLSKPLRRLHKAEKLLGSDRSSKGRKGGLPNLGKLDDIADFIIGGEDGQGYVTDNTSGSEIDTDAEVEVMETSTRKVLSAKARQRIAEKEGTKPGVNGGSVQKKGIKLVELGPRMRLRMTKVEEGVCSGKTMWHEYIEKSKEEVQEMEKTWEKRRKEKEERKRIQKENVEKKRKEKGSSGKGGAEGEDDDDDDDPMDVDDEWDSEGLAGDGEAELNEEMEDQGEWEDEADEIAAG